MWRKILTFLLYKTKLQARRRYSVLERFILRFRFGKALFENLYLVIMALTVLGSVGAAFGVYHALQQIEFTANTSHGAWQVFYFN